MTRDAEAHRAADVVVKLGGGLLREPRDFGAVAGALADGARGRRVVVVPGGGPFADAVRALDRRLPLSDDDAHWMAVLAMDQYAHLVASAVRGARLVEGPADIADALAAGAIPVLAPFRWLHVADPLPHSWDVTSDSIAAWVARALGAPRLVLVKPAGASDAPGVVDAYFSRALGTGTRCTILPADRASELAALLADGSLRNDGSSGRPHA